MLPDLLHGIEKNKFTSAESNEIISFLERAFVRLEAWFQWFNTTQSGIPPIYFWLDLVEAWWFREVIGYEVDVVLGTSNSSFTRIFEYCFSFICNLVHVKIPKQV